MDMESVKYLIDIGLGGMSFALFLRLGKVVANHEIRITGLENENVAVRRRRARRPR